MQSHMDVDDDFVTVESREEVKRLLDGPDEKKKKKYFRQLFEYLGGGNSPIEALELALGRDETLQENQMSIVSIFSLWADELNRESVKDLAQKQNILYLLSSCNVGKFAMRLILINPKNCGGKVTSNQYLHYHCLNILQHITDEQYIDDKSERLKNYNLALDYKALPRILDFLDINSGNPLTMLQASALLKNFVTESDEACMLIYRLGGLKKCLHIISRKQADKMFMDYFKETCLTKTVMQKDEIEILHKYYCGKMTTLKRFEKFPRLTGFDFREECITYMAKDLMNNCALVVYKVINKWFNTPCIWRTEQLMLQYCFNILRNVIEDAQKYISCKDVIKHYNILEVIQEHLYNPDKDVLIGVLNLLGVFARQYSESKTLVTGNPVFVKAVSIYINSYEDQIQIGALQTICTFVQFPSTAAKVLEIGLTAEKIHLLSMYNVKQVNEAFGHMKTLLARNCSTEWRDSKQTFKRTNLRLKYSVEKAKKYKEEGNAEFKAGKFEAALRCYTLGLECCPPVENFGKENTQNKKSNWFVLPSALLTNRAQCYLCMKKWQEAVDDCTAAIVRSYEENKDARRILLKTVYRRARAFLEMKDYRNALCDVSFCLRRNPPATNVRTLFHEILALYRKKYGLEPVRRCGACMEGVGMKLKRCAKCPEVYCCRECQAYAWEEGHKNYCNYTLEEQQNGD